MREHYRWQRRKRRGRGKREREGKGKEKEKERGREEGDTEGRKWGRRRRMSRRWRTLAGRKVRTGQRGGCCHMLLPQSPRALQSTHLDASLMSSAQDCLRLLILRLLILIFVLLVARTTTSSDLRVQQAKTKEWKVWAGKGIKRRKTALAGNRTRVSRMGGENSTTEPPMPLSAQGSDGSPERISRATEGPTAAKQRGSKIGLHRCLWKTELTDWQALGAEPCEKGLQAGNSMKWEHSNENIKISASSAHTTTLKKAPSNRTTDPCRKNIGISSRSLFYDPIPATVDLKLLP